MKHPVTPHQFGQLPSTGYVRQSQLIGIVLPFSAATLWRKVKSGDFPAPVKLGDRITAWRVEQVRAWLDQHTDEKPLEYSH